MQADLSAMEPEGVEEQNTEQRTDPGPVADTPSKLRLRLYQRAMISILATVCLIGLGAVYLASIVPNFGELVYFAWFGPGRQDEAPPPSDPPVLSLPPDSLADVPIGFRKELMASSPLLPAEFSRNFKQPIDQLCAYLGGMGFGKFTAMHNPVADGQWICSSDVLPASDRTASSDVSSVFVWMRGTDRREVDLVRFKINLTDPATSDVAKLLALTLLGKLHTSLRWDMPEALTVAVRDMRDANFIRYGVSYQITREWSSVPRLNVIIRIMDRSGIISADAFTAIATNLPPRDRPTPRPAKFRKPSAVAAPPNPDTKARSESGSIENLMQ